MTKYIRSRDKLIVLIKEIFGVCEISIDTKVIVLVLAGTLPSKKFKRWIDQITQLNPLNAHFKQINAIRWEYGANFRNYILLMAMQAVDRDVVSDELQLFIGSHSSRQAIYNVEPIHSEAELFSKSLFFSKVSY